MTGGAARLPTTRQQQDALRKTVGPKAHKVLLIDDDDQYRQAMTLLFRTHGFEPSTTDDLHPDLVIVDLTSRSSLLPVWLQERAADRPPIVTLGSSRRAWASSDAHYSKHDDIHRIVDESAALAYGYVTAR